MLMFILVEGYWIFLWSYIMLKTKEEVNLLKEHVNLRKYLSKVYVKLTKQLYTYEKHL